jgi:hypothetical protein
MPAGFPAGGIFKPPTEHPGGDSGSLVSVDTVAADLSSLGVTPVVTAATSGGRDGFTQGSIVSATARPALVRPAPSGAITQALSQTWTDAGDTTGHERAVLPDLTAYWFAVRPVSLRSKGTPQASPDISTKPDDALAADTQGPGVARSFADLTLLNDGDDASARSARNERRGVTGLAIYGAACMTVGVAAPGLTPLIRRRKPQSV